MEWYWIVLISCFGVLLLFVLLPSLLVAKMIARPKRYSRAEQNDYNVNNHLNIGVESLVRENWDFTMSDGYVIHGDANFVPGSHKFCILLHGHQTTREGALRYSVIFKDLGYSTLIYDERGHGDNVHGNVTMGAQESKDLSEIVDQVLAKCGPSTYLGIQGVSMGAATALLSTQYQQKAKFIVSDCAYARLGDVIVDMLHHFFLPGRLLLPFITFFLKIFNHFSIRDCEPLSVMGANKIPVLFIHGESDTFVSPKAAHELYEACTAKKKLVTFPNAQHASSITVDRGGYMVAVSSFLNELEDK